MAAEDRVKALKEQVDEAMNRMTQPAKKGQPFQPSATQTPPVGGRSIPAQNDRSLAGLSWELQSLFLPLLQALSASIRANPEFYLPTEGGVQPGEGDSTVVTISGIQRQLKALEDSDKVIDGKVDAVEKEVNDNVNKKLADVDTKVDAVEKEVNDNVNKKLVAVGKDINDLDAGIRHIEIDVIPTKIQAKTDAGEKVAKGESVTAEEGKQAADIAATKDIADKAVKTVNAAKEQIDETDKQAKKTAGDVNTALSQVNTAYDDFENSLKAFNLVYPKLALTAVTLQSIGADMDRAKADLSGIEGGIADARLSLSALKLLVEGLGG